MEPVNVTAKNRHSFFEWKANHLLLFYEDNNFTVINKIIRKKKRKNTITVTGAFNTTP